MKQFLIPEEGKFYKANLHCHSTFSDGRWTVEKLKEEYKKRGYSVIAYSDHDKCFSHDELTDDEFVAITSYEISISDTERVKVGKFRPCYHFNAFAVSQEGEHKELLPVPPYEDIDAINAFIAELNKKGFIVSYNHPNWSLQTMQDYVGLKGLFATEIYNHSAMVDGIDADQETQYDIMLRNGSRLYPIMTDDNHDVHEVDSLYNDSFGGYVMIKAPCLTYDAVMDNLIKGNFYASMAPEIYSLYVEDGVLKVECSDAVRIMLTKYGRNAQTAYAPKGQTINSASFELNDSDIYYRLRIVDEYGRRANTRAYFADEIFK
ncbi:MAG: PHP domain-containing protein [Clostridiales bacterium]|nr:PHP domain-containing protein [Clostridiales bacterium]